MYNLPKTEKLTRTISIDKLFSEGESFLVYPIRVIYRVADECSDAYVKIITGVSKRRFKKAVDRNRIKRLMRESYRLNKKELVLNFATRKKCLHVAFFYIANEIAEFSIIETKMKFSIDKIIRKTAETEKHE